MKRNLRRSVFRARCANASSVSRVASRSYHESVWESVPERSRPIDLQPRLAFLLGRLRYVRPATVTVAADASSVAVRESARASVLDVGCGAGEITSEIARAGFDVVGIDVAEEPLRRARARDRQLDVRLVAPDGEWPLPDMSFDAVWAGETLEHVLDTAAWLSEVRRVLRSGGTLVLSTPAHDRLSMLVLALSERRFDEHFDPRSDHIRFYTRRTLARLLADFGFEQIDVRGAGGGPGARRTLLASAVRSRF
jgi:2-polyprenyl-3-methyl-5-hydroxy-6-metoxy-1,4-benzoquinol methylase